jgi:hypothetical protein
MLIADSAPRNPWPGIRNSKRIPIRSNLKTHNNLSQTEEKVYLRILTC